MEFVEDGGYFRKDWWVNLGGGDKGGWEWRCKEKAEMPKFWIRKEVDGNLGIYVIRMS